MIDVNKVEAEKSWQILEKQMGTQQIDDKHFLLFPS